METPQAKCEGCSVTTGPIWFEVTGKNVSMWCEKCILMPRPEIPTNWFLVNVIEEEGHGPRL